MVSPPPVAPGARHSPARALAAIAVVALVLGRFGGPLGDWIGGVGTAAHEASHAAVADVLTGDVLSITVFRDGGGVTFSEGTNSDWRRFLVAGAGYPGALLAALALLSAAVFARSSRAVAGIAAGAALLAAVLWTPWTPAIRGIDGGDQRFTWLLLLGTAVLLGAATALPERWRRVALGAVAVGLLTDAFRAGRDLVAVEGARGDVRSDADTLAESMGVLSSSVWAWLMRLALFVLAGLWVLVAFRYWAARTPETP